MLRFNAICVTDLESIKYEFNFTNSPYDQVQGPKPIPDKNARGTKTHGS